MSRLQYSQGKFDPRDFGRFIKSVKDGLETFDYDSQWVATPADLIFTHNLGVLPKHVIVHTSANKGGSPADSDSFTELNNKTVKVAGTKAYTRVLINA